MKNFIALLFIYLFSCLSIFSQTKIVGKITDTPSKGMTIYLYKNHKGLAIVLDSVNIKKNGKFTLNNNQSTAGIYYLRINNTFYDLILSPNEKTVKLSSTYPEFIKGIFSLNESVENHAYIEYKKIENDYNNQIINISGIKKISPIDSFATKKTANLKNYLNQLVIKRNKLLFELSNKYKNTYTADVTVRMNIIPMKDQYPKEANAFDNDLAFLHYHFWDLINFNDSRILNSSKYVSKIEDYLTKYSDYDNNLGYSSIDMILQRAKVNIAVYDVSVNAIIRILGKMEHEKEIAYLLTNYVLPLKVKLSQNTKDIVNAYNGTISGMKITDFPAFGTEGQATKLSELYPQSKYTMIYFWRSDVNNIAQINNNVHVMSQTYKDKGLNIIGFSFDNDNLIWKKALEENKVPWLNISAKNDIQRSLVNKFKINELPYILLLDQNGTIITKNPSADTFDKILRSL